MKNDMHTSAAQPEYTIQQVLPGLYSIDEGGVCNYMFSGKKAALLIDTGFGFYNYKKIAEEISDLPLMIANTHFHEDHYGGNGFFNQIYLHPYGMDKARKLFPQVEYLPITEGYKFELGERDIEVIECPGHTRHDVTFLDIENRALVGGDTVTETPVILRPDTSDIQMLQVSIERLISLLDRYDLIYPSHGRRPVKPYILEHMKQAVKLLLSGVEGEKFSTNVPDGQIFAGQLYKYGDCTLFMLDLEQSKLYG